MDNDLNNNIGKIALWFGAGCLVSFLCVIFICILSMVGLVRIFQPPENIKVSIDAPLQVETGDEVELVLHVQNEGTESVELYGVDISMDYLNGVILNSAEPPFSELNQYDGVGNEESYQSYYFYEPIAPGETFSVTFYGVAVAPGDYSGTFDICIDSDFSCINNFIRTVVR
jgi:hypothetical protein